MPYASKQDLIDSFGAVELEQLTDRTTPPAGAIDDTVVDKALGDADQLIDGHLQAAGYALPLASVPGLVKQLAGTIARYLLHAAAPTETVRKNYEDALRMLRDIAAKKLHLNIAGVAPAQTGDDVQVSAPERIFTPETLKDF